MTTPSGQKQEALGQQCVHCGWHSGWVCLLVQATLALTLGLWPVWGLPKCSSQVLGDSVVICGHVSEPVDSGLALVRLRLSPHRTRRGQEWAGWVEPDQLWWWSCFGPKDAGCWPEGEVMEVSDRSCVNDG